MLTVSDARSRTMQNWLTRGVRRTGRDFGFQTRRDRIVYVFGRIVYIFGTTLDLWCGLRRNGGQIVYVFGQIVYVFGTVLLGGHRPDSICF